EGDAVAADETNVDFGSPDARAVQQREGSLLELEARERRADRVLAQHGPQLRTAATTARASKDVLDATQIEELLHLGLVARALQFAAGDDAGEVQQRPRDRGAGNAVDLVPFLRNEVRSHIRTNAGDPASLARNDHLDVGRRAAANSR